MLSASLLQSVMAQQDQQLDELASSMSVLKTMSRRVGQEVDEQAVWVACVFLGVEQEVDKRAVWVACVLLGVEQEVDEQAVWVTCVAWCGAGGGGAAGCVTCLCCMVWSMRWISRLCELSVLLGVWQEVDQQAVCVACVAWCWAGGGTAGCVSYLCCLVWGIWTSRLCELPVFACCEAWGGPAGCVSCLYVALCTV